MNLRYFYTTLILILSFKLFAQNPILPPGVYIADPSAHQWSDGRMYIYGSKDESKNYYCSWNYDVLSSSDLISWDLHENSFASKGMNDEVDYSDDLLYAPDCNYINGKYYLFYCLANNKNTNGIAYSSKPEGPFIHGKNINTYGINEIDPAVFVDNDGKTYFVWGQFNAKIAELKPSMTEIDSSTIHINILTEKEHYFHEGAFLTKKDSVYYLVYAHMGRAGRPTSIGYATSNSPFGPYKYRGVIIDNDYCDPEVWNNHGSIAEFNDKWYVFYHRSTHASNTMRKVCVEPITFLKDGTIPEVVMTSQGTRSPFRSGEKIEAEWTCLMYGDSYINSSNDNEEVLIESSGDQFAYKYIDFDSGISEIVFRVGLGNSPVKIDIIKENPWGALIGSIEIPAKSKENEWRDFKASIDNINGVHALWFRFSGEGDNLCALDYFILN